MTTQVKEETHEITQLASGIVATDVEPGDDLNEWDELWRLQVPVGFAYVFTPADIFALYCLRLAENLDAALADNGGVLTNETVEAASAGVKDMTILPAVPAKDDAYYFGSRHPFALLRVNIGQQGAIVASTPLWEYWSGAAWVTLTCVDGTVGFTAAVGAKDVVLGTAAKPTAPSNWAKTTVGGLSLYWIRFRESHAAPNWGAIPLGTQAWVNTGLAAPLSEHFKIELRDASEEVRSPLLSSVRYTQLTEFQDLEKLTHLDIAGPVVASEGMWIAFLAKATAGVLDASASYFKLSCKRIRTAIFAS